MGELGGRKPLGWRTRCSLPPGPPSFPNALYLGGWNGSEALPLSPRQASPGNAKKRTSRSIAKRQQRIKQQKPASMAGFWVCAAKRTGEKAVSSRYSHAEPTKTESPLPQAVFLARAWPEETSLHFEHTKRSKAFRCVVAEAATTIDRMRFPPFPASPEADAQGERGEDKFHLNQPAGAHETSSSLRGETYPAPQKRTRSVTPLGRGVPEKYLKNALECLLSKRYVAERGAPLRSIFSLKPTERPVISKKSAFFPLTPGRATRCRRLAFTFFKGETL